MEERVQEYWDETTRVKAQTPTSQARLIVLEHHEQERDVVLIALTVDGYDLGRKYAGFLTRSGLWFEEYRDHWLWLVIAFFGGVIGTKLLDLILARMTSGKNP